jgi:hypothetical protein
MPEPPLLGRGAPRHVIKDLDPGTDDSFDNFYPQASSQRDALRPVGPYANKCRPAPGPQSCRLSSESNPCA